jgi:hypothetical protein
VCGADIEPYEGRHEIDHTDEPAEGVDLSRSAAATIPLDLQMLALRTGGRHAGLCLG